MQNSTFFFSQVKWFQFVNEQLSREQESPRRIDCHGPPHAPRVGRHDDRSPPRRLAAVARSDPWKTPPAQVGFYGDATRRRTLPWVVGLDVWNNSRGEDYLPRIGVAKIAIPSIELIGNRHASMTCSSMSKGSEILVMTESDRRLLLSTARKLIPA